MNTIEIIKAPGHVEILHNSFLYQLGERPLITIDRTTGGAVDLNGFGFWLRIDEGDKIRINNQPAPESVDEITEALFKIFQ